LALCLVVASAGLFKEEEYQLLFSKWMNQHSKKFSHDNFFYRYTVFKNNLDFIVNHNKKNLSYTVGMNAFGDQTTEEFVAARNGYKNIQRPFLRSKNAPVHTKNIKAAPPAAIDWRSKGAVTPVKDQGQCGSCWAFSTTGSTEGAHAIATGQLVSLSEQQLMDCSSAQGNQGCNGGLMDQAFEYIIANGGICSEASYPYLGYDATCNTNCKKVATIKSYTDVPSGVESDIFSEIVKGPVSIAIEADQQSFQFYSSGIYSDPGCGTNLDHGVLIVGYSGAIGKANSYWIVKNSWGASWGDNGYIELAMGQNECGLDLAASQPDGAASA
jgi:cathepsin L